MTRRDWYSRSGLVGALLLAFLAGGCNLRNTMAEGQIDAAKKAGSIGHHWDAELVRGAFPYAIVQLEGAMEYAPHYEPLHLLLIQAYVSYATGWLREDAHDAQLEGNFDKAEQLNRRAGLMYDHALIYAKHMLRLRDDGFDEALAGGMEPFKEWLETYFFDPETDTEVLVQAGTAWLATMAASEEGLAAAVDLPYAKAVLQRAVELDPEAEGARALSLLGRVKCSLPKMMGGNPDEGMKMLKRALDLTDGGNHLILVTMAEQCAVAKQDQDMFYELLRRVIESGDVEKYRMSNKIARRQAERLLSQPAAEYFY